MIEQQSIIDWTIQTKRKEMKDGKPKLKFCVKYVSIITLVLLSEHVFIFHSIHFLPSWQ